MYDIPPETIAEDLTAEEYYDLGLKYRTAGWIERCRDALKRAIKAKDAGTIAEKASIYLKSRLPVASIPPEAEKRNIEGYNEYISNPTKAKEIFAQLIKDYPDFEWPYSNLANYYLRNGDTKSAIPLLEKAIQLNPFYQSALMLMAEAYAIEMNYSEANRYINRAINCDPCVPSESSEERIKGLKHSIEQLGKLMGD